MKKLLPLVLVIAAGAAMAHNCPNEMKAIDAKLASSPKLSEADLAKVKTLRSDHRLNIGLTAPGPAKIDSAAQGILDHIKANGGFMAVTDKSPPEAIYKLFGVSKKVFKQAIGSLYKHRLIVIESAGLRLCGK